MRKKLNKKGFTLIEVLTAVAVLAIALTGLLALFVNTLLLNEANGNLVTAVNDAQFVLEQIRNLDFDSIGTYAPEARPGHLDDEFVSISRTNIGTRLREVRVSVSWTEKQRARNIELSTRFARGQ